MEQKSTYVLFIWQLEDVEIIAGMEVRRQCETIAIDDN
jgi:hypothetical protein